MRCLFAVLVGLVLMVQSAHAQVKGLVFTDSVPYASGTHSAVVYLYYYDANTSSTVQLTYPGVRTADGYLYCDTSVTSFPTGVTTRAHVIQINVADLIDGVWLTSFSRFTNTAPPTLSQPPTHITPPYQVTLLADRPSPTDPAIITTDPPAPPLMHNPTDPDLITGPGLTTGGPIDPAGPLPPPAPYTPTGGSWWDTITGALITIIGNGGAGVVAPIGQYILGSPTSP